MSETINQGIFIFVQQTDGVIHPVSLELLGEGKELAAALHTEVTAVLGGKDVKNLCQPLADTGADRIIICDDPALEEYRTEPYAALITDVIHQFKPDIFLYGATAIGRDLAPRVAARVHTGLTADCTKLEIDPETGLLLMTRPAFGGNLLATIICKEFRPQMATVRPGVMKKLAPKENSTAKIIPFKTDLQENNRFVEILQIVKENAGTKDISHAKILVSGGRGVGSKENFKLLEDLADALGGTVSCSRPVVDSGWMPKSCQVGQTGQTVRPHVYFAIGISGAIQHLAGMEESDIIIAINKDETAPIFNTADYGIVGDLNKILPELTRQIRTSK